jgi:hypothetical protein
VHSRGAAAAFAFHHGLAEDGQRSRRRSKI